MLNKVTRVSVRSVNKCYVTSIPYRVGLGVLGLST
jgi:hypothetical protein